jgi:uncharacterized protein (DUF362 family)
MIKTNVSKDAATSEHSITRREFNLQACSAVAAMALSSVSYSEETAAFPLAVVKNPDREGAIKTAFELLGAMDFKGRDIYLKGNFNSADGFPATTHPQTLYFVSRQLRARNCGKLTLVERSGMGSTREIWNRLGIYGLAKELDISLIALEDLKPDQWARVELAGSHWQKGIEVPRFLSEEASIVQISNLKTHRFGGQFSASLKNSIGLIAKHSSFEPGHNYMAELHGSPDQRRMIAEANQFYSPELILMDAMAVFVDGGPESGDLAYPGVILASRNRVAMDAAGLALLRSQNAKAPLSRIPIFEQEQVKRAVELDLGVKSSKEISMLASDAESMQLARQLEAIMSSYPLEDKASAGERSKSTEATAGGRSWSQPIIQRSSFDSGGNRHLESL